MSDKTGATRFRPYRYRQTSVDEDIPLKAENATFDRLKLSLPYVRVNPSIPYKFLFDHLKNQQQHSKQRISLVRRGNAIHLAFQPKDWHFGLKIKLILADGAWIGAAALEVNAMRLFASLCRKRDTIIDPSILKIELIKDQFLQPLDTLDSKDNYIDTAHLPLVNASSWPQFVQRYIHAIADLFLEIFTPSDTSHPLLDLPPFHDWIWRDIEVCYEFYEGDATSKVVVLSPILRSLANAHKVTDYGSRTLGGLQEKEKTGDMLATRVKLTKAIEFAVYAKAATRLRIEVRYKSNILKSVRLAATVARSSSKPIEAVLDAVTVDAARRANTVLEDYRSKRSSSTTGLTALCLALSHAATACAGRPDFLRHLITQFITHQGVSKSKSLSMQRVLEALLKEGVLTKPHITLREPNPRYVLSEGYFGTFAALGQTDFATALLTSESLKPKP